MKKDHHNLTLLTLPNYLAMNGGKHPEKSPADVESKVNAEEAGPSGISTEASPTTPFSAFTKQEKWILLAMIGVAGFFR